MSIRFNENEVRPMGLVAAGVNGMKLEEGDQVVGAEVLPAPGEVFLMASDGKAKRVDPKDFPRQGRYGKGVIAWDLPRGVSLAGMVAGKGHWVVTVHLVKAAAKSNRLDEAGVRRRSAARGNALVEVKPGDSVTGLTLGWMLERYVKLEKEPERKPAPAKKAPAEKAPAKKSAPAKKTAAKKVPAKKSPAKKPPAKKKKGK